MSVEEISKICLEVMVGPSYWMTGRSPHYLDRKRIVQRCSGYQNILINSSIERHLCVTCCRHSLNMPKILQTSFLYSGDKAPQIINTHIVVLNWNAVIFLSLSCKMPCKRSRSALYNSRSIKVIANTNTNTNTIKTYKAPLYKTGQERYKSTVSGYMHEQKVQFSV